MVWCLCGIFSNGDRTFASWTFASRETRHVRLKWWRGGLRVAFANESEISNWSSSIFCFFTEDAGLIRWIQIQNGRKDANIARQAADGFGEVWLRPAQAEQRGKAALEMHAAADVQMRLPGDKRPGFGWFLGDPGLKLISVFSAESLPVCRFPCVHLFLKDLCRSHQFTRWNGRSSVQA